MALKKCKECGKEVSTKADLCPHCGAKQKSKGIGCGGLILILIAFGFISSQISDYNHKANQKKQAIHQEEIRQQKEELQRQKDEKLKIEKQEFEAGIESHYAELIKFAEGQQFDNALDKINLFKKYGKIDYKDVAKYQRTILTQSLSEKVKTIPASEIEENLKIYKELLALNPNQKTYKDKVDHYQKKWDQYVKEEEEKKYRQSCQLEIVSSRWTTEYSYAIYEGQVKNISNLSLKNVQAVVTWYDKSGNMITSRSSLIEYNPILPGQSSPFKVMKTYNPAMKKAGVEFSHLMGGKIRTYQK